MKWSFLQIFRNFITYMGFLGCFRFLKDLGGIWEQLEEAPKSLRGMAELNRACVEPMNPQTGLKISQWKPAGMEAEKQASVRTWTRATWEVKPDSHLLPTSTIAKPWVRRVERKTSPELTELRSEMTEKTLTWPSLLRLVKFLPTTR